MDAAETKVSYPVPKRPLKRPKSHTLCPKSRWRDQSLEPYAHKAAGENKVSNPVLKRLLETKVLNPVPLEAPEAGKKL